MKLVKTLCLALALTFAFAPLADAGRMGGPGSDTARCEAYGSVTYHERFYGGETAVVSIAGDGDTDLDLFVYDGAGRLVAQGIGLSDRETVRFYVPAAGTYRVVVRNLGGVYNLYRLTTN